MLKFLYVVMLLMATIPVAFHGDADAAIRLIAMVMAMELAMKSPPSGQTQQIRARMGFGTQTHPYIGGRCLAVWWGLVGRPRNFAVDPKITG